jgi:DNA-binding transcriptional ArsR family regulator
MQRKIAANLLAEFIQALDHPDRIRIVAELGTHERNVAELQKLLDLTQPVVSRHLATLRVHKIVLERRDGKKVFYRLAIPSLSRWIIAGVSMLEEQDRSAGEAKVLATAKRLWGVARAS